MLTTHRNNNHDDGNNKMLANFINFHLATSTVILKWTTQNCSRLTACIANSIYKNHV